MDHTKQKGPEQQIGLNTWPQGIGDNFTLRDEILIHVISQLDKYQWGQKQWHNEIEYESIQAGQAKNTGSCSGQRWHWSLTVLQQVVVISYWALTVGFSQLIDLCTLDGWHLCFILLWLVYLYRVQVKGNISSFG